MVAVFEVGQTVYVFGHEELKGTIDRELIGSDEESTHEYLIVMHRGRWWFEDGFHARVSGPNMYISTIVAHENSLEAEPGGA